MTIKKYEYILEEKLTYTKGIKLETNLSEDELISTMEKAERISDSIEDVAMYLDEIDGIKVLQYPDKNYSSPNDVEIEYYDHVEIK